MKIGLIGYGFMGGAHAAAIQSIPGITLAALASHNKPTAETAVKGNLDLKTVPLPDSVRWTSAWEDVVSDPSIDAVDICVPSHMHRAIAESAFQHGKHVLCEKPMALSVEDCAAMMQAADASGKVFMVAQVLRWMWPYPYAHELVMNAGASAVTACTLRRSTGYPQWSTWLGKREISGGALLDLLSHDIDQALLWFGVPDRVSATAVGPVETTRAVLHYKHGFNVVIEGGWTDPGTEFAASFEISAGEVSLRFADGVLRRTDAAATREIVNPGNDPYLDEIAYFVECCRTGSKTQKCMPAESANAVQLALLLERSRDENGRELKWQ